MTYFGYFVCGCMYGGGLEWKWGLWFGPQRASRCACCARPSPSRSSGSVYTTNSNTIINITRGGRTSSTQVCAGVEIRTRKPNKRCHRRLRTPKQNTIIMTTPHAFQRLAILQYRPLLQSIAIDQTQSLLIRVVVDHGGQLITIHHYASNLLLLLLAVVPVVRHQPPAALHDAPAPVIRHFGSCSTTCSCCDGGGVCLVARLGGVYLRTGAGVGRGLSEGRGVREQVISKTRRNEQQGPLTAIKSNQHCRTHHDGGSDTERAHHG